MKICWDILEKKSRATRWNGSEHKCNFLSNLRQKQYIRRENIVTYGVEKDKDNGDDGKTSCSQ